MNHKSIVFLFLLLFFVVAGGACAACSGYFFDAAGHSCVASALGWTAGLLLLGAVACTIGLIVALGE